MGFGSLPCEIGKKKIDEREEGGPMCLEPVSFSKRRIKIKHVC